MLLTNLAPFPPQVASHLKNLKETPIRARETNIEGPATLTKNTSGGCAASAHQSPYRPELNWPARKTTASKKQRLAAASELRRLLGSRFFASRQDRRRPAPRPGFPTQRLPLALLGNPHQRLRTTPSGVCAPSRRTLPLPRPKIQRRNTRTPRSSRPKHRPPAPGTNRTCHPCWPGRPRQDHRPGPHPGPPADIAVATGRGTPAPRFLLSRDVLSVCVFRHTSSS